MSYGTSTVASIAQKIAVNPHATALMSRLLHEEGKGVSSNPQPCPHQEALYTQVGEFSRCRNAMDNGVTGSSCRSLRFTVHDAGTEKRSQRNLVYGRIE